MNVVRCDGCGATRESDIDYHGWLAVEVGPGISQAGYNLDACSWACLRDVAVRLGDLEGVKP